MKIVKFIAVSILALFLLTACAEWQTTSTPQSRSPVIDRIVDKGELVVGTMGKMPPLNMTTKTGNLIGLEVDMVKSMAAAMGVKYRFESMAFSELLPALEAGRSIWCYRV